MKKMFLTLAALICLILICFAVTSCNDTQATVSTSSTETQISHHPQEHASSSQESIQTPQSSQAPQPEPNDPEESGGEEACLFFNSLEEYEGYFKEYDQKLPDHFVSYEAISGLGEFVHFTCALPTADWLTKWYNDDLYFIVNDGYYQYSLSIGLADLPDDPYRLDYSKFERKAAPETNELWKHQDLSSGVWETGGVLYCYGQGRLDRVRWVYEGLEFILNVPEEISFGEKYSAEQPETLVSRFFFRDTFEKAIEELNQRIFDSWQ